MLWILSENTLNFYGVPVCGLAHVDGHPILCNLPVQLGRAVMRKSVLTAIAAMLLLTACSRGEDFLLIQRVGDNTAEVLSVHGSMEECESARTSLSSLAFGGDNLPFTCILGRAP
jgi:hypothetical protein